MMKEMKEADQTTTAQSTVLAACRQQSDQQLTDWQTAVDRWLLEFFHSWQTRWLLTVKTWQCCSLALLHITTIHSLTIKH